MHQQSLDHLYCKQETSLTKLKNSESVMILVVRLVQLSDKQTETSVLICNKMGLAPLLKDTIPCHIIQGTVCTMAFVFEIILKVKNIFLFWQNAAYLMLFEDDDDEGDVSIVFAGFLSVSTLYLAHGSAQTTIWNPIKIAHNMCLIVI
jgi:hypothetical protein